MTPKLKLTNLAAALTAAFGAGMALDAHALLPGTYNPANAAQVRIAGATAQDGGVLALSRLASVCVANSLDVFVIPVNTTANNAATFAYFCTPAAALGLTGTPVPTQLVVYKQSGGSGDGIGRVANNTNQPFVNMAAVAASYVAGTNICGNTPTVVPLNGALTAYNAWTCGAGALGSGPADGGVADVEPGLLTAAAADIGKLQTFGTNQVIFGVPVSLQLYRALQRVQGKGAGDDEANMPSLTKPQIANLYTGTVNDWGAFPDLATDANFPTNTTVYVSRRLTNSGSQATTEVVFLNGGTFKKCTASAPNFVAINNSLTGAYNCATLAGPVFGGSGNPDVANCLHQIDLAGTGTAARWGIGLLSTECVPGAGAKCPPTVLAGGNWRYIKIDGAAPSQINVAQGEYTFYSEASINWRKAPAVNLPTGNVLRLLQVVRDRLSDPTVIAAVNANFNPQTQGFNAGLMGITNDGSACVSPLTAGNLAISPVNNFSKSASGQLSNCAPAQQTCAIDSSE